MKHTLNSVQLTKETHDKIDKVKDRLWKQGFGSLESYGKFYGYKNGIEVLKSFGVTPKIIN